MKEKILAYVKDNCLFVSVIAVLMVIFCFFLWMTYGAGNSMEAETSYTDVTALSTSSSKQSSQSLSEASSQSKTEGSEKGESKVTVDVKGALVGRQVQHIRAVNARFLKYPIGQIIPCWGIDSNAVSRRVGCRYHTEYQHQRQQKRRPIPHFPSHRGIPPTSVYIAVFAWTEIPPTRIGRLLP